MSKKADKKMRKLEEKYEKYTDSVVENVECQAKNLNEDIAMIANSFRSIAHASERYNALSEAFDQFQTACLELHDHEASVVLHIIS